jgi:DNA-binding transcriptional MocR family regulator
MTVRRHVIDTAGCRQQGATSRHSNPLVFLFAGRTGCVCVRIRALRDACTKAVVDQIQSFRAFSAGWTSRILQGAASFLLRDPGVWDSIAAARTVYAQRRSALSSALRDRGVPVQDSHGLFLWVPVASEPFALVTLAARNIVVVPGSKISVLPSNHIRVATSILRGSSEHIADAIALAFHP